jgi:hypothetical protein
VRIAATSTSGSHGRQIPFSIAQTQNIEIAEEGIAALEHEVSNTLPSLVILLDGSYRFEVTILLLNILYLPVIDRML